jgi:hypothetical protein
VLVRARCTRKLVYVFGGSIDRPEKASLVRFPPPSKPVPQNKTDLIRRKPPLKDGAARRQRHPSTSTKTQNCKKYHFNRQVERRNPCWWWRGPGTPWRKPPGRAGPSDVGGRSPRTWVWSSASSGRPDRKCRCLCPWNRRKSGEMTDDWMLAGGGGWHVTEPVVMNGRTIRSVLTRLIDTWSWWISRCNEASRPLLTG